MILKSAFNDGDRLPEEYANAGVRSGLGQNISPPFKWENVPPETESFALIMVDYQAVSGPFIHWLVIDIPADVNEIAAGASGSKMPMGARELDNSYGLPVYGGARPPVGTGDHGYKTTVYALNTPQLDLDAAGVGLARFEAAIAGKVLTSAEITGFYSQ